MPKSTARNKQTTGTRKKGESRAALEQEALEGRGRNLYKYFLQHNFSDYTDLTLLQLSYLWLYCDPKRELDVDQFMELTEPEIHERYDNLKSKNHLKILTSFEKVIHLYAVEDDKVCIPYRYAV